MRDCEESVHIQQYFLLSFLIFLQCLTTVLKALDGVVLLQVNEWCFAGVWYMSGSR